MSGCEVLHYDRGVADLGVLEGGKKIVKRRKKSGDPPPPPPTPTWQTPSDFPVDAAAILRKGRISKRQYTKYIEQLSLFMLTHCSADYVIALQDAIRRGDKGGMDMFAKVIGLVKNDAGITVNLQNNLAIQGGNDTKGFDSLVRQLDARDRKTIDVNPVRGAIEE